MSRQKEKRLFNEVRDVLRLKRYSIHTERSYCDWIKHFVLYHRMRKRHDLRDGENKMEPYLTHLAVDRRVSASTQNQAMNALVFQYKFGYMFRCQMMVNDKI